MDSGRLSSVAAGATAVVLIASCAGRPQPPVSEAQTWRDVARQYVRLAVALGERDPDSLDTYFGDPAVVADVRKAPPPLAAIRREADRLAGRVRLLPGADAGSRVRRRWLTLQVTAIARRVDVVTGANLPFDRESAALFGMVAPHGDASAPGAAARAARRELDRLLPGTGPLADRYDRFDRTFLVPPDRLRAVFEAAIAGCRAQTLSHVPLPPGEQVSFDVVGNRPWGAFSRYQGSFRSRVQVNGDFGWTVDRALQTACHETYPGHHVQSVVLDRDFVRGRGWTELEAQPFFSPAAFVAEGAASLAADLAFPGDERLRFERDVLFPAAGLDPGRTERYVAVARALDRLAPEQSDIARRYLDGELEFERAAEALDSQVLMAHPEAALKYINEYRTYVLTYTYAPSLVSRWLEGHSAPGGRWQAYAALMSPAAGLDLIRSEP
jgi:hypothetical protein